jgi:hypothetical protein
MPARHPLPRWTVPAVAAAVLVIAGGILAALWWWVDGQQWADPANKTTALLDVVKVASGVAVGGGGLFALYLAARRQRTQELELAHTEADATARRVTDLYAKAVEQLGSDKAPVRLGGLYALERLAQDAPAQRQTIVNVLCAYLRMPSATGPQGDLITRQEREVRVTAQRILAAHQRSGDAGHWPGLHLDLSGATLIDANFSDCELYEAKFTGAEFTGGGAMFVRTTFTGVASFSDARFRTVASFDGAVCTGRLWFAAVASPEYAGLSTWPDGWKANSATVERDGDQWRRLIRTAESAG